MTPSRIREIADALRFKFALTTAARDAIADALTTALQEQAEEHARLCEEIELVRWTAYKEGDGPERANPLTHGESDGACMCANAIRELSANGGG